MLDRNKLGQMLSDTGFEKVHFDTFVRKNDNSRFEVVVTIHDENVIVTVSDNEQQASEPAKKLVMDVTIQGEEFGNFLIPIVSAIALTAWV